MTMKQILLLGAAIVFGVLLAAVESRAQADPQWLKSWNEALQSRPATLASSGRIATEDEPGEPLVILGRIVEPDGTPARGVVVHAYHRDKDGFDFGPGDQATTTWRLQGWVVTDAAGRFKFYTIRPAADHLGREGAHIHLTIESDEFGRQWAPVVYLADDPLVTAEQRRQSHDAGEFGWVRDTTVIDGAQHIEVAIKLRARPDF